MKTTCPVCASPDAQRTSHTKQLSVPYGPEVTFVTYSVDCPSCGESYVSDDEPEEGGIEIALRESKVQSAIAMLEYLSNSGVSNAYLERALRLPARTTARWKGGVISAASLSLLRLVRTFPWLLDVADADFDPMVSAGTVLKAAGSVVLDTISQVPCTATVMLEASSSGFEFGTHFKLERDEPDFIEAKIEQIAEVPNEAN